MAFDRYASQGRLLEWTGHNKRVLDVGCAHGAVAAQLVARGCTVVGLEMDAEAAEKARAVCEEVHVCNIETLDALPYPQEHFDVVLYGDILEHLYRPDRALAVLLPYLKPDGVVIASTPNVANWGVRMELLIGRFDYYQTGWVVIWDHIRFFTFRTFEQLFTSVGLAVTQKDVTPGLHLFKPYKWLIAWWLCKLPGYGRLTHALCRLFKGLLAHQIVFVATKSPLAKDDHGHRT